MKVLAIALLLILSCLGCAQAATRTLVWDYPTYNQLGPLGCFAGADTCKDLSRVKLIARMAGAVDTTVVLDRSGLLGRFGRPDSVAVTLPDQTDWDFWMLAADATGNWSCRSPAVRVRFEVPPVSPILKP